MGHFSRADLSNRGKIGALLRARRGTFIFDRGKLNAPFMETAPTSALYFFRFASTACDDLGALGHFFMKLHMVKKERKNGKMKRDTGVYARASAPPSRRHASEGGCHAN